MQDWFYFKQLSSGISLEKTFYIFSNLQLTSSKIGTWLSRADLGKAISHISLRTLSQEIEQLRRVQCKVNRFVLYIYFFGSSTAERRADLIKASQSPLTCSVGFLNLEWL